MNRDLFIKSRETSRPPSTLEDTLTSLWWDKKGDWDRAHAIAQSIPTVQASAVHAYLQREEGVLWNADYRHAHAGRQRPGMAPAQEWLLLVGELLQTPG
jgi:hypothetical protein